jgi:type 2 lantibiotic biosynthesis protein LanM
LAKHSSYEKQIRRIAARATPLWDRKVSAAREAPQADRIKADRRLRRWRELLGSAKVLNHRLRCSDLSRRAVASLLTGQQQPSDLPCWTQTLSAILRSYQPSRESESGDTTDPSFKQNKPLPFQEVLIDFMRHARARFVSEAGDALELFAAPAITDLERSLLAHLTFVASRTIGLDFYKFRFEQAPASAIESVWSRQAPSTRIYSAYVQHMQNDGLVELLETYPVLGRLLAQSVEQWVQASTNLCRRFRDDFSDLRTFFGWKINRPKDAVKRLRTDLSDRHHGGQMVTEFILRTDERVVYKPRTVQPEIAFYDFVDWVNGCGTRLDLKVIRALDRTTHGWVEYVRQSECKSEAEVERFYTRCGMLIAIIYAFGTTDVHSENLIANGEHPVIVDLETLLSGTAMETQSQRIQTGEDDVDATPSVLSSGFLPRWQVAADGHQFDTSALAADDAQDPGLRLPVWKNVNTDQMTFAHETGAQTATDHRVSFAGDYVSVRDHLPRVLEGFKEVYFLLLANRQKLLLNKRLLAGFDELELRILVRGSVTYAQIHLHLLHPEFLKDGIDRSVELEWLARPLSATATPQKSRLLMYETERKAMELLDIPHFTTSAWKDIEFSPDDPDMLNLCSARDSHVLRQRLAHLSTDDCAKQLALIEDAVRSRFA